VAFQSYDSTMAYWMLAIGISFL